MKFNFNLKEAEQAILDLCYIAEVLVLENNFLDDELEILNNAIVTLNTYIHQNGDNNND